MKNYLKKLYDYFNKPESPYGLSAFRIILGVLVFISLFRYLYFGWVTKFFYEAKVHFKYPGFEWVHSLPAPYMDYLIYALLFLSVFFIFGWFYRLVSLLVFTGFLYIHLIDQSLYLNHYYLVCWLLLIMIFLPADASFSFRLVHNKNLQVRKWHYWILRFQIGVVYFFAGLAKLSSDWLLEAQPMNLWLGNLVDLPFIGGFLDEIFVQYLFSWTGFIYDLTIPFWLMMSRARPYAYVVVIIFHFFTSLFFPIGLFPYIMTFCALIFFSTDWPLRVFKIKPELSDTKVISPALNRMGFIILLVFIGFHILMPLRHFIYPGNVLWNEEGMRFSWKVMVREKNGSVSFRVKDKSSDREWIEEVHGYLAPYQAEEMSGIPDMILQMAHIIGKKHNDRGLDVEVYADAKASLNGRKFVQFIDSNVNLLKREYSLKAFDFVMPEPRSKPYRIKPLRRGL